ncbi:MAG: hypothetical protein ACOC3W_04005, partial [Thermodesulfobacteriota bacterium]
MVFFHFRQGNGFHLFDAALNPVSPAHLLSALPIPSLLIIPALESVSIHAGAEALILLTAPAGGFSPAPTVLTVLSLSGLFPIGLAVLLPTVLAILLLTGTTELPPIGLAVLLLAGITELPPVGLAVLLLTGITELPPIGLAVLLLTGTTELPPVGL